MEFQHLSVFKNHQLFHQLFFGYICHLFYYKDRNFKEIEILQDELSAIVRSDNLHESKKLIYKIYETATDEPHSFLYINLLEKNPDKMFMKKFSHYLRISDK